MTINEVAERYGIASLETFQKEFTEIEFYESILNQTDHIPNKIIESLIENLADATALNFIGVFVQFIADIRVHYNDVLKARKLAREKINELNGETVPETTPEPEPTSEPTHEPTETVTEGKTA